MGLGMFLFATPLMGQQFPYQNTNLTPEERASDLLGRLTLEEKAALMQNASPAIPRLGIKAYDWWNEALHGVGRAGIATVFPQTIGMAASFDDNLIYKVFTAVSDEARAKYTKFSQSGNLQRYQGLTFWTPNINIFRDPRWGRGQETYGEDPYLTSRMGVAVVRGLQGPANMKYDKLHACAKHYAVHSGPEWNRHSFNAENIAPRDLWETYLPAFKALVEEANVKEVMCAYNRFEGEPCCGSNRLLMQILRDEWKYKGIVVSDCGAISDFWHKGAHETHPDKQTASAGAVLSGTDLECGNNYESLPQAVKDGLINEEQINVSVKRLLTARFELGEMDEHVCWDSIPYSVVDSKEHKDLALEIARKSIVLLQNHNHILPLKKGIKIALIGPNANDSIMQWGNYNGFPSHTTTLYEALKQRIPADQLIYDLGCDRTNDSSLESVFGQCSIDGKPGFKSTYWNNIKMEGKPAAITYTNTPFHFTTLGATVFAAGVNIQDFSARYESAFTAQQTEDIDFHFETEGAIRLCIDGKEVAKGVFLKNNMKLYTLKAEKGKTYNIQIDFTFFSNDRAAQLNFDMGRPAPVNLQASIDKVKPADVIVFAGGISPSLEGEEMPVSAEGFKGGDRTTIELPAIQRRLVSELKKLGKPIIFVNYSGSAVGLEPESKICDAILQAWYPGQAGGTAIADVLLGEYNPSGKLPVTFYKHTDQLPDFQDYSMKGRTYRYMTETPLYCFGHGLSYTKFEYGTASLSNNTMSKGKEITLTVPVRNTGETNGEEVVQVYLSRPDDKEAPSHTLRAFKRVYIPKGETANVNFTLNDETFQWFDTNTNTMRLVKGNYELLYGGTSDVNALQKISISISE
ncbi:xylan 1,4-beta-xylosidase [Phocaeicola sp. HCN-6420]|uniref:xylan 1,4-beta-xylosidase n=1 Tax=Phocaeicola sp. HCN-6420 TaxID=3134673 RepID=UPI0030BF4165